MITPGSTIGVLGGGQLGRMFAQAAQTLGYRVHVFEPVGPCPAGVMANKEVNANYDDTAEAPSEGGCSNEEGHEANGHTPTRFSLDVLAKGCGS